MLASFGQLFLVIALTSSLYAVLASFVGAKSQSSNLVYSGQRAAISVVIFLTLAIIALESAILSNNFQFEYVASYSSRTLPAFFKFTTLWAGQAGSLLFWGWILSLYTLFVILNYQQSLERVLPYVIGILMLISVFFNAVVAFAARPFELLAAAPLDGRGLNPLLQHWAMVIHPPILYLGYVGFAVPFAFALGALLSGQVDNHWVKTVRRWTIIPWFFLGIGMLLGGKWAYMELGWGGYWAWDPVENAAFMPWLAGTAFLHSIMIQEKKSMLKVWNMVLIIVAFTLCIFGTFLTRSGVISSVHSFTQSAIGPLFMFFVILVVVSSFAILYWKSPLLKSEARIESIVSRESTFLINNVVFIGACFAVFWGTVFPVISEAVRGVKITVGPPFFNSVNVPIFLFLLFMTGIGPLVAWRKSSPQYLRKMFLKPLVVALIVLVVLVAFGMRHAYALISFSLSAFVLATILSEFHRGAMARSKTNGEKYFSAIYHLIERNRRRYGGYIVHFAVVLMFFGITGSAFDQEVEATLKKGESIKVKNYEVVYNGYRSYGDEHKQVLETSMLLKIDGKLIKEIHPQRHLYLAQQQPLTQVAVYSRMLEDFYVVFVGMDDQMQNASFKIYVKPLVNWLWLGGMVLTLGTLVILLPNKQERLGASAPRYRSTGVSKAVNE